MAEWEDEAIEVTRKAHSYEGLKKDIGRLQGSMTSCSAA